MKDSISLAMPTYNGEQYLREQLDSIYAQTRVPDEVIVIDDCSTDGTVAILEEYHKKYGLKYYVNDHNLGYSKNFEKAISLCTGDYICLCDQDDVWLPTKIEKSYNKIKEYPKDESNLVSSFSSTNIKILRGGARRNIFSGDWKLNFSSYTSQGCTLMFNKKLKETIIPFPPEVMYDVYIGLSASMIGNRYYIGEELMYYRIHNDNAFIKKKASWNKRFIFEINKYVPYWFPLQRYQNLLLLKAQYKEKIKAERISYIDDILSIYESSPFRRIHKILHIKELNVKHKSKIIAGLIVKIVFRIKDIH